MNDCACNREVQRWVRKRDDAIDSIRKHVINGEIKNWIKVFGMDHTFKEIEKAKADILAEDRNERH